MDRARLLRLFRYDTQDTAEPYLWSDEWVFDHLDEAQDEACIRGRLLHAAGDAAVCEVAVAPGQAVYPLHPALYELTYVAIEVGGRRKLLKLISLEALDDWREDWRGAEGEPRFAVQDDTGLRLVPSPFEAGRLLLEGYRLPLNRLADDEATPLEIHRAHHRKLIEWVKHRAYMQPDSDGIDLERAAAAERAFTSYFGARPDVDLRRATRVDLNHHNKAWL
ncbi:MAG TPA: hypothetical protein DCR72_12505 [Pseudomonas sp.]|nr:hypothetical protein [Pseudomonas sp.]